MSQIKTESNLICLRNPPVDSQLKTGACVFLRSQGDVLPAFDSWHLTRIGLTIATAGSVTAAVKDCQAFSVFSSRLCVLWNLRVSTQSWWGATAQSL